MKIADYGKAITSYIESPTTAQKLKSKESANLLAEVDFSGMSLPALKIYYERETGLPAPKDSRQLIIELKRLMKGLDEDGVATFATGGRVHLAEGSEDIVEPSKSMQVDTTTKGLDLFTIDDFKEKAYIYVGALHNAVLPTEDIKSALNKFTQKGIDDGTFTADDAIKIVQDLKFQFQDRAQKQRLRNVIIEGTGTVKRKDLGGGTKLMDEYLGAQKEYQKAVDDGFQGTYEEFLRYKYSGSFADGGRVELSSGGKPVSTKSIGGGVYEVTYKGGTKTYYGKYTRDGKTFKKSFGTDKEAAANFVIEGQKAPPAKSVIELQKGATTLETPKYKKALSDALEEVSLLEKKGYGDVDGIVKKYQKLFTEKVGTKTKTGKTIKKGTGNRAYKAITFAIREHANRLNIQSIKNVNAIKALDAYQKLETPQRGDLTKIAKQYNVPSGTFERLLTNLNIREKIPLQFSSDAEYKKYLAKVRSDAIDEFSSKKFEKFLQGVPTVQKSHMGDLYNQFVTTGNIGFAPQKINAEALKTIDANLKAINEEVKLLFKNKPEGYVKKIDALNQLGDDFAAASQGYKKYQGIDPYTGKDLKVISFSKPSQELDPSDLIVDEKGNPKKLSELTEADKSTLAMLKKDAMRAAKLPKKEIIPMKEKILDATGKVLKGAGKVLKPLGYAIGTNAIIQAKSIADEMGIELKPQDYFMALDSGDANIAINNYKRRNDPEFAAAERAKDLAQMTDDFEEVGQTTFGKYNDQIKNIKLP